MSEEQLTITLRDTQKHLFQLRFQSATDRLETPSEIQKAKKDIARILTIQRERQLEKLSKAADADLDKQLADLEPKTEGPGKRRAKREIARLTAIKDTRAEAQAKAARKQQPAKGK